MRMKNEQISHKQRLQQRCEKQGREFLALKSRLPEVAIKLKSDVAQSMRPKLGLAEEMARSLLSDGWPRVYPKRMVIVQGPLPSVSGQLVGLAADNRLDPFYQRLQDLDARVKLVVGFDQCPRRQ